MTVSSSGKIKAVKKGTAKITVASQADKTKKATVTVKVTVPVKKITITSPDTKNLVLKKGKTYKLKTSVAPSNAANKKLTYTTSKKKYVTVSSMRNKVFNERVLSDKKCRVWRLPYPVFYTG